MCGRTLWTTLKTSATPTITWSNNYNYWRNSNNYMLQQLHGQTIEKGSFCGRTLWTTLKTSATHAGTFPEQHILRAPTITRSDHRKGVILRTYFMDDP